MSIKGVVRNKWFMFGVVAVLATVIVTAAVLMLSNDGAMRIQKVDYPDTVRRASDFSESRLYIHEHGTFTIRIVYKGNVEWVGIGTWKKPGNKYVFTYIDVYSSGAGQMQRSTLAMQRQTDNPEYFTYPIKNGRVYVHDVNNRVYQFS